MVQPESQCFEHLGLVDELVVHEISLIAAELVVGWVPLKHLISFSLGVVAVLKDADQYISIDGLEVCLDEVVVLDDPHWFFGRNPGQLVHYYNLKQFKLILIIYPFNTYPHKYSYTCTVIQ